MFLSLFFLLLLLLPSPLSSLTPDGTILLSFKHSILHDPLSLLSNWDPLHPTPCSWSGILCMPSPSPTSFNLTSPNSTSTTSRVVTSLLLPNSQLLGSIPPEVFLLPHLRRLDLSGNFLNGTIPTSLSNATQLKTLSLSNNEISGQLPDLLIAHLTNLQLLNLSDNALTGTLPHNITQLQNLTVLGLSNNYLSGSLPIGGFQHLQILDLSSNLLNGSVPGGLGVTRIRYLNLSYNKLSGEIPPELGLNIPDGAAVDFSFNNLTGEIPQSVAFSSQDSAAFEGNADLCGKPLKNLCVIASTLSDVPAKNPRESPPALAAIPKTMGDGSSRGSADNGGEVSNGQRRFKLETIAAIVVGDLGGIGLVFIVFLYVYQFKKKKKEEGSITLGCCLRKKGSGEEEEDETSGTCSPSESEGKGAILVTVDGEIELERETLLKSAAYILGATGSTIVYKAVLAKGTALAVRRIGEENAIDKLRDFEVKVQSIARFRHPNLARILGFYWGPDEKLLIHEYATNGSLASISFSKLNWEARFRIARGLAKGLAYIHDKKSIHGNIKPSNILLSADMEAKIGDFGLDHLIFGESCAKSSKRPMQSERALPELLPGTSSRTAAGQSLIPYQAPESVTNYKPNAKWDVYSFGVVLLELMAGRMLSEEEIRQWNTGFKVEARNRVVRMADPALRGEVKGKEEGILSCFKLGFDCASMGPQRRPNMKDAVMLLDGIQSANTSVDC